MAADEQGSRKFHGDFPTVGEQKLENSELVLNFIENNQLGSLLSFNGPFGERKVLYCDYTASGRSLKYIEGFIQDIVLPHYGNTHTTTSVTSLQTTMFRDEARDIVRSSVNASENDAVIFTGSGCTAAVNKLIHALDIKVPPVVFVSPYEHHSNLLPWKEIGAEIVWIKEDKYRGADLRDLENQLLCRQNCGRPLFGCFSAASNITGILVDVDKVAACLHKYGALAFFDYATAGPYVQINMNPSSNTESSQTHKDAVFLSPHKFVGGPGTPGILVAKKKLFRNRVPYNGGGGSVFFVTENSHRYLKNIEMREEGGTPAIVESIRAGLVFQLKQKISHRLIVNRDKELLRMAKDKFDDQPSLIILGCDTDNKLPIFSFVIKHQPSGRLLHHNFVSAVLNDLFGIQSRGGCACAGPYAQKILGMSETVALKIEDLLIEDQRLDRHHLRRQREYSDKEMLSNETIEFILQAVLFVAEHGWKLLPQYTFNPETGEWKQKQHQPFKDRKWLGSITFQNDSMQYSRSETDNTDFSFKKLLAKAEELVIKASKTDEKCADQTILFGEIGERYRWFLLPSEAQTYLNEEIPISCRNFQMPFEPNVAIEGDPPKYTEESCPKQMLNLHLCDCAKLFTYENLIQKNLTNESFTTNGSFSFDDTNGIPSESDAEIRKDEKTIKNLVADNVPNKDDSDIEVNTHDEKDLIRGRKEKPGLACLLPKSRKKTADQNELQISTAKFHNPPKAVFSPFLEAVEEFNMIQNNDRLLLCLSGGKDSLSMLHAVNQYKYYARKKGIDFKFGAMTVDPQSAGYDPSPLKGYLKMLGVAYHYEEQDIIGAAAKLPVCESICSYCSRMKRGRIYACARREGYNVIALGQHLDDIAESFLMSTFHNGYLRSMKAHYTVREKDIRVIRPLIYAREKDLRKFAGKAQLPVIPENCPACFEAPKERHRMKQLLAHQEVLFPNLFQSLRSALKPLISKDKTGLEKRNLDDADNI